MLTTARIDQRIMNLVMNSYNRVSTERVINNDESTFSKAT